MPEPTMNPKLTAQPDHTAQAGADESARLRQACRQLGMPFEQALAWKHYPDRIVILFKTGQKLTWRQP